MISISINDFEWKQSLFSEYYTFLMIKNCNGNQLVNKKVFIATVIVNWLADWQNPFTFFPANWVAEFLYDRLAGSLITIIFSPSLRSGLFEKAAGSSYWLCVFCNNNGRVFFQIRWLIFTWSYLRACGFRNNLLDGSRETTGRS